MTHGAVAAATSAAALHMVAAAAEGVERLLL